MHYISVNAQEWMLILTTALLKDFDDLDNRTRFDQIAGGNKARFDQIGNNWREIVGFCDDLEL